MTAELLLVVVMFCNNYTPRHCIKQVSECYNKKALDKSKQKDVRTTSVYKSEEIVLECITEYQ